MLSFAVLIALQSKVLNYDIVRNGKLIGDAKVLIKITADGGKRTDSKLSLSQNDKKLDMHTTQVWALSGRPTLKIVQIFDAKGVETSRTRVDFRVTDVLVTYTKNNKLTKSTVVIPPKAEIRDLPEFWFLRDEPEIGKPLKYWVFNATDAVWEEATSTYVGPDKSRKLRNISQQIAKRKLAISLDADGFPVETISNDGIKIVVKL